MMPRKRILIFCALIALCAFIYMSLPSSQNTRGVPRAVKYRDSQQQTKTGREDGPRISTKPNAEPSPRYANKTQRRENIQGSAETAPLTAGDEAPAKPQEQKRQSLENRVQEFKEKYPWENTATKNLAEYLIGNIPRPYRDSGLTAIIKNLDEAQKLERSGIVSERMLLEAIEKDMPDDVKPSFQRNIDQYKQEQGR